MGSIIYSGNNLALHTMGTCNISKPTTHRLALSHNYGAPPNEIGGIVTVIGGNVIV